MSKRAKLFLDLVGQGEYEKDIPECLLERYGVDKECIRCFVEEPALGILFVSVEIEFSDEYVMLAALEYVQYIFVGYEVKKKRLEYSCV